MIDKEEIFSMAGKKELLPTTIEKDYVLSWLLAGISEHPVLNKLLVFKGGTCLKKCFFADYRFSEDLDFVLLDNVYLDAAFFLNAFQEVCSWVAEESNIEFLQDLFKFEKYMTPRKLFAVEGRLRYRGPLRHRSNFPKIKIDISAHEALVLEPEIRSVLHGYSDQLPNGGKIRSYCFEEIFAEKIRAMIDRARPRDLYDIIYLNTQRDYEIDQSTIRSVLLKKCANKNIPYPTQTSLSQHSQLQILTNEWENMLGHQISKLKPIKFYLDRLPDLFDWISAKKR